MVQIKLYTVKQVAEMIGYKEGSVRNMISDGKIESVRFGGSVRITKEAIEKFTGLKVE